MDFRFLQKVALAVSHERSVDAVLNAITEGLAAEPNAALARIWLMEPGDICPVCPRREECNDQTECLHLASSRGNSRVDPDQTWSSLEGDFRRFPLGARKVGQIGLTGKPLLLSIDVREGSWLADPDWAREEGIESFAGQPLVFRGETLGVLAVFCRKQINEEELEWLETFASQAAVAIANVRAFEEIESCQKQQELENAYLRKEIQTSQAYGEIIGASSGIRKVLEQVELVAPTDAAALITGETGTGKELVARAIHERSARSDGPFIKVNCAAVPRDLFESEFFGHVKGAFSGAIRDRMGRFQLADGGTLFLDEVGEIPMELQGKLLRVIQEGEFERIGEENTRQVNVRIISATNRDLRGDPKSFRQDLYFRLSVFPIEILPLRERPEDIAELIDHFILHSSRRLNLRPPRLTKSHVRLLQSYDWPGNIRELQNVLERAVILSHGGPLQLAHEQSLFKSKLPARIESDAKGPSQPGAQVFTEDEMKEKERANLVRALDQSGWKVHGPDGAARVLGIKPTTLAARMRKMGIRKPAVSAE